ncbi:hypothetical protein D3C72_1843130 [compost metagenome]
MQHGSRQVVDGFEARGKQLLQRMLGSIQQGVSTRCGLAVLGRQPLGACVCKRCANGIGALRFAIVRKQPGSTWMLQQLVDGGQVRGSAHG